MTRLRRGPVVALALLVSTACATPGAGDRASSSAVEVTDGVAVEVPDGWRDIGADVPDGVTDLVRYTPGGAAEALVSLQVVAGCGDEPADDLVAAAAQQPRGGLVPTAAEDATFVDVDGLDAARRTVITLGAGRVDDADTARVAGLYGSGSGLLLLVEYTAPTATFDRDLAQRILGSVHVDIDVAAAHCD